MHYGTGYGLRIRAKLSGETFTCHAVSVFGKHPEFIALHLDHCENLTCKPDLTGSFERPQNRGPQFPLLMTSNGKDLECLALQDVAL